MSENRTHLDRRALLGVARAAFGGHELVAVQRLRGGTKKGVYRLVLDDATTGIAYVWHADEDYWATESDQDALLGHANGPELFTTAHAVLSDIGVRVPQIILLDRSATLVRGDVVVVHDIRGGSLEDLRQHDPRRAEPVLARLGETIQAMHHHRNDHYGRPGTNHPAPAPDIVLDRALDHLADAATRVDRIAAVEQRLSDTLHQRHATITPRTEYGLIHGELGPDHILIDEDDQPVLIDIEAAMYFDIEWEHAFLELRFGDDYRHLHVPGLDDERLRLYRLAMYLSLITGPLRLLDGDFPHRAAMQDIVETNINRALAELS